MPSGPCKEFRMRTQRDKESKKSRGGENGKKQPGRRAIRSSIKVQLRNSIPVAAQWEMRLSSIWTCSGSLLTSVWGTARNKHVHKRARALAYTRTSLWSPLPCQHPSREIRRLETGQPWPMYIFMGLIWHHFSPLLEKEMYLIYTIPIWPVHQGEIHIGKVGLKSGFHLFSIIYFAEVYVCKFVYVCVCLSRVSTCTARMCLCKGENRNISSYSRAIQ